MKRLADTYYPEPAAALPAPELGSKTPTPRPRLEQRLPQPDVRNTPSPMPERRVQEVEPMIFSGTGFFVATDGSLVTNSHVVDNCASIRVRLDNRAAGSAQLIARDKTNDLALLRTDAKPMAVARLRSSVRLGENVAVFGYPHTDMLASAGNFTLGNITALSGLGDDDRQVQISAPVQSGNSGGPLLDANGNVVGVIVSKLNALKIAMRDGDLPQNVNFAIKTAVLAPFLDASHIRYTMSSGPLRPLDAPELANDAKAVSAFVICVQR